MTEHPTPEPTDDPDLTRPVDDPTVSMGSDSPTMTGPTVGSWPFDQTDLAMPAETGPAGLRFEPHPSFDDRNVREGPGLGYYILVAAAILVILGMVAAIGFLAVSQPVRQVAGAAVPASDLQPPATVPPTTSTQRSTVSSAPPTPTDPLVPLAEHPLSTSDVAMAAATCALTRFDPADDRQAVFYQEAKVCADAAWQAVLPAAGLPSARVELVIVRGGDATTPCGTTVKPTDPPTQCRASVYLTPAYLRDTEQNGRYPGRYLGVFLREYARAIQDATGITALYNGARSQPGASTIDLDNRLAQQATCLAGMASGAMAGQGAVDTNITNEIRDRLTSVDAPPAAETWLDKGFQTRQLASCNTWAP
jgi:hypothetical protein